MATSSDAGKNNLILRRQLAGMSMIELHPISCLTTDLCRAPSKPCRDVAELKKHPVDGFSAGEQDFAFP